MEHHEFKYKFNARLEQILSDIAVAFYNEGFSKGWLQEATDNELTLEQYNKIMETIDMEFNIL